VCLERSTNYCSKKALDSDHAGVSLDDSTNAWRTATLRASLHSGIWFVSSRHASDRYLVQCALRVFASSS